jgi:hypothetical protein
MKKSPSVKTEPTKNPQPRRYEQRRVNSRESPIGNDAASELLMRRA